MENTVTVGDLFVGFLRDSLAPKGKEGAAGLELDAETQKKLLLLSQKHDLAHLVYVGANRGASFTDAAIKVLNEQDRPIVFILWGRPAQMKKSMLNNPKHLILEAPHPSPLSSYRGFFGSKPFSQTNRFLEEHGVEPIDWQIDEI